MKSILVIGGGSIGKRHIKNLINDYKIFCHDKKKITINHKNFTLLKN